MSDAATRVGRRCGPPGAIRGRQASGSVFETPALVAGFENVAVVGQPVEQRRSHLGVGEDTWPFGKGEIGRQNDRGALVEPTNQVEQHLPAADREWQVAHLVENDEIDADQLVGEFSGLAGPRFGLELVDQIDGGEERTRAPLRTQSAPMAMAMWLLPVPVPPIRTALRWAARKSPSCSSRTSP